MSFEGEKACLYIVAHVVQPQSKAAVKRTWSM